MSPYQAVLLPGAILPAELAYPALIAELGPDVDARAKELEVYRGDRPPGGYSLETEVEGIRMFADDAGFDRFHLVGYSGGGASSLAFCATYPERLISLTLNEPAWAGTEGRSEEEQGWWARFDDVMRLPFDQMLPAFTHIQLREDVAPPPPPPGQPPPWMNKRPPGLHAFADAFERFNLDLDRVRAFDRPVLFTLGGKSHPSYYAEIAKRLATIFPHFTVELFEDRHHFDPPHRTEPKRMAVLLKAFWEKAEAR
jgi:pimeloyl-ACP methyl ester carboxylesterase